MLVRGVLVGITLVINNIESELNIEKKIDKITTKNPFSWLYGSRKLNILVNFFA